MLAGAQGGDGVGLVAVVGGEVEDYVDVWAGEEGGWVGGGEGDVEFGGAVGCVLGGALVWFAFRGCWGRVDFVLFVLLDFVVRLAYLLGNIANGRDGVEVAQHRQSREVDDLGHLAGSEDAYTEDLLIGHDQV